MDNSYDISEEEKWDYLNGSSDDIANQKIEHAMNQYPDFKTEIEEMKAVWQDLSSLQEKKALKKSFNHIHDQHFPALKPVKKKSKKGWLIGLSSAAALALIFTIGSQFWKNDLTNASDNMAYKEMKKESHVEEGSAADDDITYHTLAQATAFSINDSLLFTSYHSIKNKKSIRVKQTGTTKWIDASFVVAHDNYDIAIIKISPDSLVKKPSKLYVDKTKLKLGEEIFGLGYPKNDLVYGKGEVSSLSGYKSDTNMIQVSVPTNPGNSGTPLFNEKGALVSLIVGKNIEEEGSAYGLSNQQILDFLKEAEIRPSSRNRLKRVKHLDQIIQLKPSIFLLEAE